MKYDKDEPPGKMTMHLDAWELCLHIGSRFLGSPQAQDKQSQGVTEHGATPEFLL